MSAFWALAALAAALGGGGALLSRWAPARLHGPGGWLWALGTGMGAHAALASVAAGAGLMGGPAALTILAVLATGWRLRPAVPLPRPSGGWAATALVLLLLPAFVAAFAPPTDTDELYQHLALARRIADGGHLVGGFDLPDGSRPQIIHALLASLYALGGEQAPRLWHLGVSSALLVGAGELGDARFGPGRGWLPSVVLAGSYTFLHEAGLAYNDLPAALWLLLGLEAALSGGAVAAGVMLGLAVSAKYTAAPAAAAVGLVLLARSPARMRTVAVAAGVGAAVLSPWWLRNVAAGLHPLFPYAGWPDIEGFRFMYAEKYGVGHTWRDAALLPLSVLFRARIETNAFLGQLSWGWFALGLGAVAAARRNRDAAAIFVVAGFGFVAWGASAQVMRYLLPLSGIAVLLGAAARGRVLAACLFLLSVPQNLGPAWEETKEAWPAVSGAEPREVWLGKNLPAWGAVSWLRSNAPPDEPVALLFAWQSYYVDNPWMLGSVEDHTPTRQWIVAHGEDALVDLRARGVRWLLVGDVRFLRKSYAFLPELDYQKQFVEPAETLRRLLSTQAVRTYGAGRWEVYRLDATAPGD